MLRASEYRPGPITVVLVSVLALAAGTFAISAPGVLAPKLAHAFDLSRTEIGIVTSLVFVGASLGSGPAGRLTDRGDPARVLGVSMALFTGAVVLLAAAPDREVLFAAAVLMGLAYAGVNPPTTVVVAGRLARRLGFFLSLKQSGVPLGGLLAGVALPPAAIAFGWRAALVIGVLLCVLSAAATPLLRNAQTLTLDGREAGPPPPRRKLAALSMFGFVMAGSQWAFLTYLVLYLTEQFRFGLGTAGLALALAQALGAGARLLWGWVSDVSGRRLEVLLLMSGLQVTALALLATVSARALAWPLVALAGTTVIGWNGAFYGLLAETAGAGNVGRVSGRVLVFIFGGSVVFPPLLGALVDSAGSWRPLWAACGGMVALAAVLLGVGVRGHEAGTLVAAAPGPGS